MRFPFLALKYRAERSERVTHHHWSLFHRSARVVALTITTRKYPKERL